MGLVYATIEIINVEDLMAFRRGRIGEHQVKKIQVNALVDSGAYMLCINQNIKTQLDLLQIDTAVMELANSTLEEVEIVGPVEVRFKNRKTTVNAAVLPGDSEVLLGSIPLEDMDVVIHPKRKTLEVNPESPYVAKKKMK